MTRRVVLGAGGHGSVVVSALQAMGARVDAVMDDDPTRHGRRVLGVEVIGGIAVGAQDQCVAAIGDNRSREAVTARSRPLEWLTIIHPAAWVDPSVDVGPGAVVMAGAVVQPGSRIGRHAIINTGASVDHDCAVGAFAHIGPGARLSGHTTVEEGAFLGTGSMTRPRATIGAWSTVGIGAVVLDSVAPDSVVIGSPARPLRHPDGASR